MTDKITISGEVKAFSNPFSMQPGTNELIIIETEKGLISVPVEEPKRYQLNQKVEVSVVIKSRDD